jgi:Tfp pilus assembly protein PilO
MGIPRDRLWMLGGLFAIVAIIAASYLLAIRPVYAKTAEYQAQVADAEVTLVSLKHDLADRQTQYKDRAKYIAALNAARGHLPDSYDVPAFVRDIQASGNAVEVTVSGIAVSQPAKVSGQESVVGVTMTLTAGGTADHISKFLDRLQNVQSRAVLITSINLGAGATADSQSATVILNAYCTKNETTCAV